MGKMQPGLWEGCFPLADSLQTHMAFSQRGWPGLWSSSLMQTAYVQNLYVELSVNTVTTLNHPVQMRILVVLCNHVSRTKPNRPLVVAILQLAHDTSQDLSCQASAGWMDWLQFLLLSIFFSHSLSWPDMEKEQLNETHCAQA